MVSPQEHESGAAEGAPPAGMPPPEDGGRRSWRATARVAGLRVAAVIEIALFLGLALAVDQAALDADRFAGVAPHPFWIIVILAAAQYGTNEGLVAAIAASAALLVGNVPPQTPDQSIYPYLFELTYRPMMWLTAAVVVGEISLNHVRRWRQFEHELRAAQERERTLAGAYESLKSSRERMELSIASELRTLVSTYGAARRMQSTNVEEVLEGTLQLVEAVMAPRRFSLYSVRDNGLGAFEQHQWPSTDAYRQRFDRDSPLFAAIVGEQRFLSAADPADQRILGDQGLMAGPVVDPESGHTIGMIKIEALDFPDLNFTAIANFKVVCELVGTAMRNLHRHSELTASSMFAEGSPLFSRTFYARQTAFLVALARRIGFPVSTITIAVRNAEDLPDERRRELPRAVRDTVAQQLRATDLAFDYQPGKGEYVVVLPNTPVENLQIVVDRLRASLSEALSGMVELSFDAAALVEPPEARTPLLAPAGQGDYEVELRYLTALAHRLELPLSLIRLAVQPRGALPAERRVEVARRLDAALGELLARDELVLTPEHDDGVRMILLLGSDIGTAGTRAGEVERSLRAALGASARMVRLEARAETLVDGTGHGHAPAATGSSDASSPARAPKPPRKPK